MRRLRKRRVIIAHGWNEEPGAGWIGWLTGELEARGYKVVVPEFPNRHVPRPAAWVQTLKKIAGRLDRRTVLVGHSLGTPTILRLLDDYPRNIQVAGIVLVAGFGDGIAERPEALFKPPLDFERIKARTRTRICIYSDNDWLIAPKHSERLADALDARAVVIPGGGHFVAVKPLTGKVTELPEVLEAVFECYEQGMWGRLAGFWRRFSERLLGGQVKSTK